MLTRLKFLTAGESHGQGLLGILDGMPAGLEISEEYIGINKDNQEPVIRTSTKYRWSAKSGGKCTYEHKMNQTLDDEKMSEFSEKHSMWSKSNTIAQSAADDEDMPF